MTNAQSYLSRAIEALEAELLTRNEADFVEGIRHYDKKQLNGLSSKQFDMLHNIAKKHTV